MWQKSTKYTTTNDASKMDKLDLQCRLYDKLYYGLLSQHSLLYHIDIYIQNVFTK